jgi:hypothetical protein
MCCSQAAYPAGCHAKRRIRPMSTEQGLKQNAARAMSHSWMVKWWQDEVVICQPAVIADLRHIIRRRAYGESHSGRFTSCELVMYSI